MCKHVAAMLAGFSATCGVDENELLWSHFALGKKVDRPQGVPVGSTRLPMAGRQSSAGDVKNKPRTA